MRGLKADDFDVLEEGKPQKIAYFAEGAPGEALPLHLGLLLDTSGSMERDLREAANAAIQFVDALDEAVDVTFLDFDSSVRVGRFQPPSYPRLFERIRERKAGGMTALYDALGVYLRRRRSSGRASTCCCSTPTAATARAGSPTASCRSCCAWAT